MFASTARRCLTGAAPVSAISRCSRPQFFAVRAQGCAQVTRSFSAASRVAEKRYTEDHEWIELSDDKTVGTIGVSTYAAKALGDVVFVELPTLDQEVSQGESIGAVESVKSASDIMTPVSGTIIEANSALESKPATINSSPESEGWLAKIKLSDPAEIESLMDATAYEAFTEKHD